MRENVALVAKVALGEIVFQVVMEDELLRTEANGYRCADNTCPCYKEVQEHASDYRSMAVIHFRC